MGNTAWHRKMLTNRRVGRFKVGMTTLDDEE